MAIIIASSPYGSVRRIHKKLFGFTEDCLKCYHINLEEIKRRREFLECCLSKSSSEMDDIPVTGGDNICKLQRTIETLDEDTDITRLRRRTEPISFFLTTIGGDEYEFITLRYFQGQPWLFVADTIGISESVAKGYWRSKLVVKAAELLLGKIV